MIWSALWLILVILKWWLILTGATIWLLAGLCILSKEDPMPPGWHSRNPEWDK